MAKSTQASRVRQYIREHGSVSRAEALLDLKIANLTAVISDMRREGDDIVTVMVPFKNEYTSGEYARYIFGSEVTE